ncbi:Transcription factor IIS N-terminal protein [Dioscorea alata]|uniref:Transcription factor IIS N-terminal protein n=1 Tax=Dioscorea alata TaxID=55571 RepID=A0ACB7WBM9_DIOAL|nr:Transcription factor IIS N-terminal protein [Dioscorea alata]
MDPEEVKAVMRSHGVDLWALIESVITVAVRDHGSELRSRRDSIVALLYSSETATRCRNCGQDGGDEQGFDSRGNEGKEVASPDGKRSVSSSPPRSEPEEFDDEEDDDEQRRILAIKDRIDDPDQPEEKLVMLLQNLLDMDITFKALKETDVGRHVNGLRKHPSGEVRRLVKLLVRKWKELVDEWVKSSSDGALPAIITDGDSPPQLVSGKTSQNGHQGIKESLIDPERLASARKRLHENYQEAQNAKKQRTIQVMDIHEIPKPKNSFISRNKGGPQGKHR